MDIYTKLVLVKNSKTKKFEDKTSDINHLKYLKDKVEVNYIKNPGRVYSYNSSNILIFESPKKVNLDQLIVYVSGFPVREASLVLDFGEYIKIIEGKGKTEVYHKSKIAYENSCLNSKQAKAVFEYFKKLSPYISVTEDGRTALFDLYKKITKISENSVLSIYLSGKSIKNMYMTTLQYFLLDLI